MLDYQTLSTDRPPTLRPIFLLPSCKIKRPDSKYDHLPPQFSLLGLCAGRWSAVFRSCELRTSATASAPTGETVIQTPSMNIVIAPSVRKLHFCVGILMIDV